MPSFSEKSLNALSTCEGDLQRLFKEVIKERDCAVLEGHRNEEDQNTAFMDGSSNAEWGESPHNTIPSGAADVIPYPVNWEDKDSFYEFASFVLNKAMQMGIRVEWGGFFKSFFDGPHWQLIKE